MSEGLPVEVIAPDGTVIRPGGWERSLRGRTRLALFALVAALVVAAVGFGLSRLFTAAGGVQSPESTVREFLGAIEAGDLTGAASMLRPIETETLVEPVLAAVGELQRLGLVDPDADPSALFGPGPGPSFADVELSTEQVSDRVAFVELEGEVPVPSGGLLPVPLLDLVPLPGGANGAAEAVALPPGAGLAVVVEDGQSYVSVWYTVAELARRDGGAGPPGAPALTPQPSDTPEEVGSAVLDAVTGQDVEGLLALLDPVEAAAVYDYSGLYLPTVGRNGGSSADEGLSFDDATVTAERDGELARITVALTGVDVALHLPPGMPGLEAGEAPSDVTVELVAVERDDGWYLSPGRTVTGIALDALAALDGDDLEGLLGPLLAPMLGLPPAAADAPTTAPPEAPAGGAEAPPASPGGWAEFVPIDDPAALALREKLPLDVPVAVTLGHFDDAFRRSGDLTVTRVYGLEVGFADAMLTETEAPDQEPVVQRFGEDVVIVGRRGGLQITVSVFGLPNTDTEAVAGTLYRAIADRI